MRRALAIGGLAALGVLSGFGCGGGDTGATGPGGSGGGANGGGGTGGSGAGGGPEQVACTGQPSTVNLGGIWAARGSLAVTLKGQPGGAITICPAGQVGESQLLLMLDIQANASDPTKLDSVKATLCSINLPTVDGARRRLHQERDQPSNDDAQGAGRLPRWPSGDRDPARHRLALERQARRRALARSLYRRRRHLEERDLAPELERQRRLV